MPCGPASIDAHVAADCPAQERQPLMKRREERLESRIVRGGRQEHADAAHALALLCASRERPCRSRSDDQRDEGPWDHFPLPLVAPPNGYHGVNLLRCVISTRSTSAQGQKQALLHRESNGRSPPRADIGVARSHVAFGRVGPGNCTPSLSQIRT